MRARELLEQLTTDRRALERRQAEADRVIEAALAGHLVHRSTEGHGSGPWRLDPVPVILEAEVFDRLAAAVAQRMAAMEALLADLYGPRLAVREGWVPGEVLASSHRYRSSVVGAPPPPRWLTSYALDVVALADGSWRVVRDLTDTPTGIGYALLDRSVMGRVAAEVLGPDGTGDLASISGFPGLLRHALAGVSPVASPRIVLFSGGVDDGAYVEHSSLARLLGFHLVEGPDLVVRAGRLWLRTLGGLDQVDVVYRRFPDLGLDPVDSRSAGGGGVPALALAAAEGGVVLANAHGAGVLEDPELAPYWPGAVAGLTGTTLDLPAVGDAPLLRQPVVDHGELGAAAVVVRLHAVAGPHGVRVMTGGNGRVLAEGDDPRRPTARLAKDVWVLAPAGWRAVALEPPLPQVDLSASVPTRVADAMYWLGRAAERAEAIARTARVVAAWRQQDPSLVGLDGGRWAARVAAALRVVRGGPSDADADDVGSDPGGPARAVDLELAAAAGAAGDRLNDLLVEATAIGEYLSATTGRVLSRLAARRAELERDAPIDALDSVLADLAALAGLWNESVVRGPAWRFGDIGRRVERALVVLELVGSCLRDPGQPWVSFDPTDVVDTTALEVLLAANESLTAYRRRHRSDVELAAAAELLLHDEENPRSYAAAVRRLADHAGAIGWEEGVRAAGAMRVAVAGDRPVERIDDACDVVHDFAASIAERWFATPVDPVVVHGVLA